MNSISGQGTTLADLFVDVSRQLMAVLIDPATVGTVIREKIVLEAPDAQTLAREWAQSLLHLAIHQRILCSRVQFQSFQADAGGAVQLKADVSGELVDPVRHVFRRDPGVLQIKDVQLHQEHDQISLQLFF